MKIKNYKIHNIHFRYLFVTIFISSKVIIFVLVIVVSAFDFWAVKNYTGRRLVGLRWWS